MKNKTHSRAKLILKITGAIVAAGGLACTIAGFANMIVSTQNSEAPDLFWLIIIGFPCIGFGLMLLLLGFRRELATYAKNEAAPVLNEAAHDLSPAVQVTAQAVREGLSAQSDATKAIACPHCSAQNPAGNKFCTSCGKPLVVTCPHCGHPADSGAAFCGNCGQPLKNTAEKT